MPTLVYEEVEVRVVKVNVTDSVVRRREELRSQELCLGCEETTKGKAVRRGLCPACYQAALRALKTRRATQSQLIRDGKMLDRGRRGRPSTNKFTRELSGR